MGWLAEFACVPMVGGKSGVRLLRLIHDACAHYWCGSHQLKPHIGLRWHGGVGPCRFCGCRRLCGRHDARCPVGGGMVGVARSSAFFCGLGLVDWCNFLAYPWGVFHYDYPRICANGVLLFRILTAVWRGRRLLLM